MQEITWPYSFAAASQDKGTWKSGSQSLIWEIAGIDGTNQGSLTAHPGFAEVWTFRYDLVSGAEFGGTNPYVAKPAFGKIIDFWSFTCRIGSGSYAYGVVYIAQRPGVTTRDLIIEGYRTDSSSYFQKLVLGASALLGTSDTDYGVSVAPTPRVVYIGVRGGSGYAVTFPTGSVNVVTSGPGTKPRGSWETSTYGAYTPTTTQLPDPATGGNPPGSFVVYSSIATGVAPTNWADTSVRWGTATAQKAGDYAFAVQFEDSLSGRRSQLSDSVAVTFTGVNCKFTVTGIVDTAKYDTVKIWRSVRNTSASGIFTAGILQLEATFKATDYPVNSRTGSVSYVTAWAYAVQKDDRQLVMQDTFQDKPSFYSSVPYAGAIASFQGQLYASDISGQSPDIDDQMRSVGEIRWSSATDGSYELFAPKARWNPEMYGDVPIAFHQAGQILLGLSSNRVFFILRDGAFVRVSTAHNGYGVTGPYAAATIGPIVYYVTKQGVRAVYPDGRLDEVGALDWLISKSWTDDLARVSMAYDPDTTALYILNPVNNKAVCLWFSSGVCSEMHWIPFRKCARGFFPRSVGGALKDCALFLHSPDLVDDASINVTDYRPRLMRASDDGLDKVNLPPSSNVFEGVHYGMIDGDCDRNIVTKSTNTVVIGPDTYYEFSWSKRTNGWTPDWGIMGAYLYVHGANGSVGMDTYSSQYYQVIGYDTSATDNIVYCRFISESKDDVADISASDLVISINPVVLKVQTANVPGAGGESGFYSNKEVSSLGVLMSGVEYSGAVTGQGANSNAAFGRWYANHYVSDWFVPVQSSTPVNPSKTTSVISIVDGPSPIHSAFNRQLNPHQSVEFLAHVVGLNFRLLAMNVRGRILETERNKNSYA